MNWMHKNLLKEMPFTNPTPGIVEVLEKMKSKGFRQILLSSNTNENISKYIETHHWGKFFDSVYGGVSIFGKAHKIKKMLKKEKLNNNEAIYIGDEARDIKASKKANLKIIAVSWGFHMKDFLIKYKPDFLIDKPREIIEIIKNHNKEKDKIGVMVE